MIEARRVAIEALLGEAAGRAIALEVEAEPAPGEDPAAEGTGDSGPAAMHEAPAAGKEHPLVRRTAELFKAKVVHVEPLRRPQQGVSDGATG